jgi:PadR family transcriptional regulator, regulatory protein AphA
MSRIGSKANSSMYAVLGILALRPQTGYEIKKLMERSTRYFWNENYGQIYPHLNQLLQNQDVTMQIIEQEGKPARKVYTITEQGKQTLTNWLRNPLEISVLESKNELLLRLFLGNHVPHETNVQHLGVLKEKLQAQFHELDAMEEQILSCYPDALDRRYWLITIHYGKSQASSLIQWCEDSIAELNRPLE